MTKTYETGQTLYFGWRNTPNTITKVEKLNGDGCFAALLKLVGPRGAEYTAYVTHDGRIRKV
jgi:hypothetical protein